MAERGDLPPLRLIRFSETAAAQKARLLPGMEWIFFTSSATQGFASEGERMVFYDRWLGRYLRYFADDVFIAADGAGGAAGYLAGCRDSAGAMDIFKDVEHYHRFWRDYGAYPAHFHINIAAAERGRGLGRSLVDAFGSHCRQHGLGGMHAITAATSPAAAFYLGCGFRRVSALSLQGRMLALFGKKL